MNAREYTTINDTIARRFADRINYHIVNTALGAGCFVINLVLLVIFLGYRPFRKRYVLLIQLCVGDLIYTLAVFLRGLHLIALYTKVYQTHVIPPRNTRECALQVWQQLKLIGDVLIPVTIFWMGIERYIAISYPVFYRINLDRKPLKTVVIPLISTIFVAMCSIYATLIAVHANAPTHYHCGRKTTFGERFSTFLYVTNIFCNVLSTLLSAAAYIKTRTMTKNIQLAQRQAHIIRYYFLISLLSTILVSLPNTIALFQVYVKSVSDVISKPSVWMQTINSGIHLFVYLLLNRDFRNRVLHMVHLRGESADPHTKPVEGGGALLNADERTSRRLSSEKRKPQDQVASQNRRDTF